MLFIIDINKLITSSLTAHFYPNWIALWTFKEVSALKSASPQVSAIGVVVSSLTRHLGTWVQSPSPVYSSFRFIANMEVPCT